METAQSLKDIWNWSLLEVGHFLGTRNIQIGNGKSNNYHYGLVAIIVYNEGWLHESDEHWVQESSFLRVMNERETLTRGLQELVSPFIQRLISMEVCMRSAHDTAILCRAKYPGIPSNSDKLLRECGEDEDGPSTILHNFALKFTRYSPRRRDVIVNRLDDLEKNWRLLFHTASEVFDTELIRHAWRFALIHTDRISELFYQYVPTESIDVETYDIPKILQGLLDVDLTLIAPIGRNYYLYMLYELFEVAGSHSAIHELYSKFAELIDTWGMREMFISEHPIEIPCLPSVLTLMLQQYVGPPSRRTVLQKLLKDI